ncbi:hypothetical protein [Antarctobacter jejuensis]|uniref:hypothetical protein n=1 Tax=Antarctobacter jejuensis TaxID=1439938 RepID=UPI003FD269D2
MLHALSELIGAPLEFRSGQALLRELYFEPSSGQIRLVAVETGHPDRFEALVDAARLSTPVREGGPWTLQVTDRELEDAPNWPEAIERGWLDPANFPMIVNGPFGGPLAPAMALAGFSAARAAGNDTEDDRKVSDQLVAPLESVRDWQGVSVFGWDGELGVLDQMRFESATRTIRELVVRTPGQREPVTLSYDRFRHRSEAGGHLVVDAHKADVTRAS